MDKEGTVYAMLRSCSQTAALYAKLCLHRALCEISQNQSIIQPMPEATTPLLCPYTLPA